MILGIRSYPSLLTHKNIISMIENKRDLWRLIIQTAISILTAIATTLGLTSCM